MADALTEEELTEKLATFRSLFPEFDKYPDSRVMAAIAHGFMSIGNNRFGKQTEYGRFLFAAHWLSILGSGVDGDGTASGSQVGAVASKSVGSASVSYDTGSGDGEAGFYNMSVYGKMLWKLFKQYRRLPFVVVSRAEYP